MQSRVLTYTLVASLAIYLCAYAYYSMFEQFYREEFKDTSSVLITTTLIFRLVYNFFLIPISTFAGVFISLLRGLEIVWIIAREELGEVILIVKKIFDLTISLRIYRFIVRWLAYFGSFFITPLHIIFELLWFTLIASVPLFIVYIGVKKMYVKYKQQ